MQVVQQRPGYFTTRTFGSGPARRSDDQIGIDDAIEWLREFHRDLHPSPGIDPAAIPDDLPYGLSRPYIRELGNLVEMESDAASDCKARFGTQDALVPLSRLKRVGGMIEFAWENQGNWSARCLAGQADPARIHERRGRRRLVRFRTGKRIAKRVSPLRCACRRR